MEFGIKVLLVDLMDQARDSLNNILCNLVYSVNISLVPQKPNNVMHEIYQ